MARPISDEELQLRKRARRRLIGAVVLVTTVVVVLPMLLDNEPGPVSRDIDIRIPAPNSGEFTSKIAPALPAKPAVQPKTPAVKPESAASPAAAGDKSASRGAPAKKPAESKAEAPKPAAGTEAAAHDSAKSAAADASKPANSGETFVVQVVALSDAQKAKQLQRRIAAAGIKSYTEVVKTAKGDVTRVRAGPYATREAAEKTRGRLKSIGLDGKIVPKAQ